MSVTRRTVVRGAAWSVPVVAVAAQAPAFAASVCGQIPYQTNWGVAAAGTFKTGGGDTSVQGFTSAYDTRYNFYLSEKDNANRLSATDATRDGTVTLTRSLTLVMGRVYTFSYTVASRYASNDPGLSQSQYLQISIGGVEQRKYKKGTPNTRTALDNGATALSTAIPAATNTADAGIVIQNLSFTYTATTNAPVDLVYLFTMPALNNSGTSYGQSDLAITAPVLTAQGC